MPGVIRFSTNVIWNGTYKISDLNGRRIRVAFNSSYKDAGVFCDIPFGVIEWKQSEQIRPVKSWLGIENSTGGAALCHQGPQSIQVVDDIIYMTLFRSVMEPEEAGCGWDSPSDEAVENGEHTFNYTLYIHQGDWISADVPSVVAAENSPVFVKIPFRKAGLLEGENSSISVKPAGLVVTAVKPAEFSESGMIVRLYNPTGNPIGGTLSSGFPYEGAQEVNFREEVIGPLTKEGNEIILDVAPYEIKTVQILSGKKQ